MSYPVFHEFGAVPAAVEWSDEGFADAFPCEDAHIEFKQGLSESRIAEAVTAFSNSDGGVILLGVTDAGKVIGFASDGESRARIHRAVGGVHSPGRYELHLCRVGGREVVAIAIHRRREGFAQLKDGRVLVRRDAMNAALIGDELSRFVSERSLRRFESTPVAATLADADDGLTERIRAAYAWTGTAIEDRLFEAGLLAERRPDAPLTVAGALCLLRRPADVLGKAFVEVFRYRDESEIYDRRFEVDGPVDEQVAAVTRMILDELGSDVVILGLHRHELPRIPEPVLREAIANAVAHRTYENNRQPVRVELRPDRVVIRSPGALPEPVTLSNMREQNAARNVDVIRVLRRHRLAEDAGMGIDVMQDAMEAALLEPPEFSADDSHVDVVLRIDSAVTPRERAWIAEIEQRGDLRRNDRLLLLFAARGSVLTNAAARDLLHIDSTHARAALHRLRDLGLLRQSGQRGGATYTLANELGPPAGLQMTDEEIRGLIVRMARDGRVRNEDVRERTGLDRSQVLALLNSMVADGTLVRSGQRRGTYYSLP